MELKMRVIKYLLLFFNFILVLGGLVYLIFGVLALTITYLENLDKDISNLILQESIILIVFSIIIVFIAFLGCCGAIRESYRMMVTFAALLLTMLIVQVIEVIYTSIVNSDKINYKIYTMHFNNYSKGGRTTVDFIQETFECCGIDGPDDFARLLHISIPGTCCDKSTNDICDKTDSYKTGCADALKNSYTLDKSDITLIVIQIGIELIDIILAVCLANSIKNAERTGHVV